MKIRITGTRDECARVVSAIDLVNITAPPEWMAQGLCAQTDPEAFFPEKGGSTRPAKQVCLGCPVRGECLAYALDNGERFGVWGGASEPERRRMRPATPPPDPQPAPEAGSRVLTSTAERVGQIRRLSAAGLSDRQVADRIGVTARTVLRIRARFAIPPSPITAHYRHPGAA